MNCKLSEQKIALNFTLQYFAVCQLFIDAVFARRAPSDDIYIGEDAAHIDYQRAQVDPSRAYKQTFAAEHTVLQLFVETVVLSALKRGVDTSDIVVGEAGGRACGRAAATAYTPLVGGDQLKQFVELVTLDFVIVNLTSF